MSNHEPLRALINLAPERLEPAPGEPDAERLEAVAASLAAALSRALDQGAPWVDGPGPAWLEEAGAQAGGRLRSAGFSPARALKLVRHCRRGLLGLIAQSELDERLRERGRLLIGQAVDGFEVGLLEPWGGGGADPTTGDGDDFGRAMIDHRLPELNLHQIFEHMLDGFALHEIILDEGGAPADYRFLAVNRAFEEQTGLTAEALVGKTVMEVLPGTEQHWIEAYGRVALTGVPFRFENYSAELGRRFKVDAFCPRRGQFACVFRDVTEHKRVEEERLRSQKLESLGVLAGGLAHDFNNILTGVYGNIQLARFMCEEDDEIHEVLAAAEKSSLRASTLTKKLLTFSRGGAPVKREALIGELVRESAEFVLHGSNVAGIFSIAPGLHRVEVDEGQIGQVIGNLVINAVQAMPEGGSLRIAAANEAVGPGRFESLPAGDYVRITVADQGVGIDPHHLGRIFDPYFTTKDKASGLGLATAFSIVKNHGGAMEAESEPGRGSALHFLLPAAAPPPKPAKPRGAAPEAGPGRALVMDDEEVVKKVLALMLERLGYEPVLTSEGAEAVNCYREAMASGRPFTAAILDLTIPGGMGGKAAAKEILDLDPQASLIVASGYSNDPVLSNFGDYGFKAVIAKPINLEQLEAVLAEIRPDR